RRVNNQRGHIDDNIIVSPIKCNVARKDMSLKAFRYQKLLDFNCALSIQSMKRKKIYIER
ncbi:hypothetical protein F443_22894, partial [Phytophthora nicotianae P1569]